MYRSILSRFKWLNFALVAILVTLAQASCSPPETPDYIEVLPRTLNVGDELPTLIDNAIIEISGGTIGESPVNVNISLLEAMGTVKYSVYDPYELREVEYEGVLLATLFDQFGGVDADSVAILAIDDYLQTIPREHTEKWPVLLALKTDGNYAQRSHRGPAMIIYPYDKYRELDPTTFDPLWVWQISHMTFN